MQHRDTIIIEMVIDELKVGIDLLGDNSLDSFIDNELLKRAVAMNDKGSW